MYYFVLELEGGWCYAERINDYFEYILGILGHEIGGWVLDDCLAKYHLLERSFR